MTIDANGYSIARGTDLAASLVGRARSAVGCMSVVRIDAHRLVGSVGVVARSLRRSISAAMTAAATFAALRTDPAAARRAAEARIPQPVKLTAEHQWAAATTVVSASLVRAESAGRSHDAARMQVEAARYALDELIQDLGDVMHIAPVEAARREAARIPVAEPTPAVVQIVQPIAA